MALTSFRTVHLSPEQRAELLHLTRSPSAPAGKARRARIVLLAADGVGLRAISRAVDVDRKIVRDWLDRYRKKGIGGLEDMPRPGRAPVFSPLRRHGVGADRLPDAGRARALAEPVGLHRVGPGAR